MRKRERRRSKNKIREWIGAEERQKEEKQARGRHGE